MCSMKRTPMAAVSDQIAWPLHYMAPYIGIPPPCAGRNLVRIVAAASLPRQRGGKLEVRIEHLEAVPVRVPYTHAEVSSLVARDGVTDVIVKLVADNGLVGWGECTRAADAAGIASAVAAMRPIVLGRDPFEWRRSRATCSSPAPGSSSR